MRTLTTEQIETITEITERSIVVCEWDMYQESADAQVLSKSEEGLYLSLSKEQQVEMETLVSSVREAYVLTEADEREISSHCGL